MLKDYYHFARHNFHFLSFGLLTAFFGNYGQSFFIAWFGKSFIIEFNLTNASYGVAYSSATLASGFLILYVGRLLDKLSLQTYTLSTSAGLAVATFILYGANEVWHLILAIFLLRFCGQGLMYHIAFTSMARYYKENRGKAIGIVSFGMPIGEAILPVTAVFLISLVGWRNTWLLLGMILILFYLPSINILLKRSKLILNSSDILPERSEEKKKSWTQKEVIQDFGFWLTIPAAMAPVLFVTGLFIHQNILLQSKQWSEEWFAFCFIVYAFSHIKASFVTGSLIDKYQGKRLIQYYLWPMFLGIILLVLPFNYEFITLFFMFLLGITMGASGPVVGSFWVEVYGNQYIGAIRSMVTSIMVISTAISPVLFGWLFDNKHSFQQVNIYLLLYILVAWACLKVSLFKKKENN